MKPLFSPQEVKDLIAEAAPLADQYLSRDFGDPDDPAEEAAGRLAMAALHFGLRACELLSDDSLAAPFVQAALLLAKLDYEYGLAFSGVDAITRFVKRAGIRGPLLALVDTSSSDVKQAVARGLDPERPGERELLLNWLTSPDGFLSASARRRLEETGGTSWWLGRFSADPSALIAGDRAAEAAARAWAETSMGLTQYPSPPEEPLVAAFEAMPAPLRSLAAEAVFSVALAREFSELTRRALETPGGRAAFLEPFTGDAEEHTRIYRSCEAVKTCSSAVRRELADSLLTQLEAVPPTGWSDFDSAVRPLTELLHAVWEPTWSLDRLLPLLLRDDLPRDTMLLGELRDCVCTAEAAAARPWFDRCVIRLLDGFPVENWIVQGAITHVVTTQEDALVRPVVDRGLQSSHRTTRHWALRVLFDRFLSSPKEEARAAVLQRLFSDPALREEFFDPIFVARGLSVTRHLLLEPATPLEDRVAVFVAAGEASRSLSELVLPSGWDPTGNAKKWRDQRAEELAKTARLWTPAHSYPLTVEEWRLLREQRDATPIAEALKADANRALPLVPSPADRAFIDRLVEHVLAGEHSDDALWAFGALLSRKDPADVPRLRRLVELDPPALAEGAKMIGVLFPGEAPPQVARPRHHDDEEW